MAFTANRFMIIAGFIGCSGFCSEVVAAESATKRNLDYFASHLRMTQESLHGQDNHITVLAIDGELDKECLRRSLEAIFHTHPNLRVKKIEYDLSRKRFFMDQELAFTDIPCEFLEISEESSWRQLLHEELSRPFPEDGPYWKICCLTVKNTHPARHYLIQFFNHSLSDGISTAQLQDEIFTYYQCLKKGQEIQPVLDVPSKDPALLYPQIQQCDWQTFKERQDTLATIYPPLDQGARYDQYTSLEHRSTQAVLFAFKIEPIYKACKEQNLTVNDALVAAGLLALRDSKNDNGLDTNVLTCLNLRNPKLGLGDKLNANQLACLFNVVVHPQQISKEADLYSTARTYHERVSLFIDQIGRPPKDFSLEEMRERYGINSAPKRNHFSGGIATSNLGRTNIKRSYGDLDLVFYQFFTNQGAGFSEALLDAVCVEDVLYCNITYVEPLRSRQWAVQLASDFVHHLNSTLPNRLVLIPNATDKDLLNKENPLEK